MSAHPTDTTHAPSAGARVLERWVFALPVARRLAARVPLPRGLMLAGAGLSLGGALIELLRPLPLQWIVEHALLPKGDPSESWSPARAAWIGAGAYAGLSLARAALDYGAAISIAESTKDFSRRLRGAVFARLMRLSPRFFAARSGGDLLTRLSGDVTQTASALTESSVELAGRAFLIVGTLAMLFWIDPWLAAGTLAACPPALFVVGRLSKGIHVATRKARRKEGAFAARGHESFANAALVQSLGRVDALVRGFLRASRRSARADCKASRLSARMGASLEVLGGIALAVALLWGTQRVIAGELSAGGLIAFLAYVRSGVKPVRQTSKGSARIAKATACGERLLEVLDCEDEIRSPANALVAPARPRTLEFRDVGFTYAVDGTRLVALSGFSCTFERGVPTLVVGPSGAGKSTLALLASRLADPDQGSVRLDGTDLRELELDSLRARIAVASQADALFGWTIRENLSFALPALDGDELDGEALDRDGLDGEEPDEERPGKQGPTEKRLWSALRAAGAEEFVRELPLGLDTELSTLGGGLSGGQRKRLCLARALLVDAPVLILDEPFSGLDPVSAAHVQRTLESLSAERILVVIAHDLEAEQRFRRFGRVVRIAAPPVGISVGTSIAPAGAHAADPATSRASAPGVADGGAEARARSLEVHG